MGRRLSLAKISNILVSRRIIILFLTILIAAVSLVGRLGYLQLLHNEFFQSKATSQRLQSIPVDARRGTIYDRNGIPLAISVSANAVYAIPSEIEDKEKTAALLAEILDIDYDFVFNRISKRTASEWIKKRVSNQEAREILKLGLAGVGVVENPERFYPYGSVAPQVLGIVGIDNQGLEGIELYYDSFLRGVKGKAVFERDAVGREIEGGIKGYLPAEDGADLVLTIDYYIQQIALREVERAVHETGSRLGIIIIADPKTGEILANAIYPTYDITNYNDFPIENRKNIAVTDTYEPGSTFKAVTAAIALETGVASLNTHFFDPGYINVSGWRVKCWNRGGHGPQNFVQTMENSCNPFYAKLGIDLGGERFYNYLLQYNFGHKMGVDFPGEVGGTLRPPSDNVPLVTWANIGFGQGLTCTPLQLLAAFGAIANQGIYSVPHYVKEIRKGEEIILPNIPEQRGIMSSEIAKITSDTLRSVIANGSGKRADVPGYRVAGKTGTAQLVENGRYSKSKTVTSFAGYAPADDPVMSGLLIIWEPQGAFFGGIIAAPVFARLVEQILPYLGVKPEQEKGTSRNMASIPDVAGQTVENAVNLLKQQGFNVEVIGEGTRIVGQVPAAQVKVEVGTKVLIYTDLDYLPTYSDLPMPFGV